MRSSDWSSDVCSSDLIEQVTILARQGELPQVRLDENGLIISPLKAATPPATEIARRAAYDRLPRVKITDLLLEVDAWTGFSERSEEHTSELQSLIRISYAVFCLKKHKIIFGFEPQS